MISVTFREVIFLLFRGEDPCCEWGCERWIAFQIRMNLGAKVGRKKRVFSFFVRGLLLGLH